MLGQNKKNASTNSVSLNKDSLVLSLPQAKEPVVWRMDLAQARAASFTIGEAGKSGWSLIKKDQDNKETSIATFEEKEEALQILMDVSETLQGGKTSTSSSSPTYPQSEITKWALAAGGVLIVAGLFIYLASITPQTSTAFMNEVSQTGIAGTDSGQTGVPISADAFLGAQ